MRVKVTNYHHTITSLLLPGKNGPQLKSCVDYFMDTELKELRYRVRKFLTLVRRVKAVSIAPNLFGTVGSLEPQPEKNIPKGATYLTGCSTTMKLEYMRGATTHVRCSLRGFRPVEKLRELVGCSTLEWTQLD
ncbi:hypothetical protein Scep_026349 [Stephania cephalantha]|uniref:Uncharacterized protein n=1 Tax=Stephania cephalantha TaxID=152367 RepID=A0AAP0EMI6_9MAGN